MKFIYKCLKDECTDTIDYSYSGLCRSCTEYIGGEPVVPIMRIKHNPNGTLFVAQKASTMGHRAITRKEQAAAQGSATAYRKHKTQLRKMKQARRATSEALVEPNEHIHDENCGHDIDMSHIGESVGEEE